MFPTKHLRLRTVRSAPAPAVSIAQMPDHVPSATVQDDSEGSNGEDGIDVDAPEKGKGKGNANAVKRVADLVDDVWAANAAAKPKKTRDQYAGPTAEWRAWCEHQGFEGEGGVP